jgi:hypothetical protein
MVKIYVFKCFACIGDVIITQNTTELCGIILWYNYGHTSVEVVSDASSKWPNKPTSVAASGQQQ